MGSEINSQKDISSLSNWAAERQFLGRFYQSQGFRDEQQHITNDCGPTSLAVVLNLLLFQANLNSRPLDKDSVITDAHLGFWQRLPQWIPNVGGATPPWGMVTAFNRLAAEFKLDWRAERHSHARRAHVIEHLMTGKTVTALKIWKNRRRALDQPGTLRFRQRPFILPGPQPLPGASIARKTAAITKLGGL